jgi:hypothetical protein
MSDWTRNYQFVKPEPTDSIASSAGLTVINDWLDDVDTKLWNISDTMNAGTEGYFGLWCSNGTQALASSATLSNVTHALTAYMGKAGTGTPTVNTTNGDITFTNSGIFRVTVGLYLSGSAGITEGIFQVGLKTSAGAVFLERMSSTVAMETFGGATNTNASFIVRAASSGSPDVDLTTTYKIGAMQQNSSASGLTLGASNASWFTIEYLRPVT